MRTQNSDIAGDVSDLFIGYAVGKYDHFDVFRKLYLHLIEINQCI